MKYVLLTIIGACLIALVVNLTAQTTLISPYSLIVKPDAQPTPTNLQVYGFMPYWNLNKLTTHHAIPHTIIYSGITLDNTGHPLNDPGFSNLSRASFTTLKESVSKNNQQLHLSFTIFSTETINDLLASESAQLQAIETMMSLLKKHDAQGINLDFEPDSPVTPRTPELFTRFVATLKNRLNQLSKPPVITIDIFGKQNPESLWQLPQLASATDVFVLMAYDYHQRGSSVAGPVAPMFGSSNGRWNSNISQSLWQLRQKVGHEKIALGLPFYGYEWRVVSPEQSSQTFPQSGVTATYDRVKKLIETQDMIPNWDKDALSPWFVITTNNEVRQIYFENQQSITHKITLAQQAQLHGIAIWALGYEGETDDLWKPFANISTSKLNN